MEQLMLLVCATFYEGYISLHLLPALVQERAICKVVELMTKHRAQEPRTLFVMGSYRIGKERAYLGAAKALGYRCHVNADKLRVSPLAWSNSFP